MSQMNPDELCQKFGYPPEVLDHLERICETVCTASVASVILTGSTSRGELTYLQHDDESLELLSDYEFLVIPTKNTENSAKAKALAHLEKLEQEFRGPGSLFHIDTFWVTRQRLSRLQTKFQFFETKACGITLFGECLIGEMPNIDLENLDFRELNEVLIWRLWAMLLYMPESFLRDKSDNVVYSYVLCRNALDLATWALPYDGVLIPSFRGRTAYIQQHFEDLPNCQSIDTDLPYWLDEFMQGKFKVKFTKSTTVLYKRTVEMFERAVMCLTTQLRQLFPARARFNDWKLRRKAYESLVMWQGQGRVLQGLRWLMIRKYELQLNCLLYFHLAACAHLDSRDQEAQELLRLVRESIGNLLPWTQVSYSRSKGNFIEDWLELRRQFAEFLMNYSRSVGEKRAYLQEVLG